MEAELTERDRLVDAIAERRAATHPIATGVLHGLVAPVVLTSPMLVAAIAGEAFGLLPLALGATAACLGIVFGVIDVPGRLAVLLADRQDPLAMMVLSIFSGVVLGGLWGGGTGSLTMIAISLFATATGGGGNLFEAALMAGLGFVTGSLLAAPGATLLSLSRTVLVHRGAPWWLAPLAGVLTTVGLPFMLAIAYSVLASVILLVGALF